MFITSLVIFYHISPSRSKLVAEAMLVEFDGIVGSDSYSAWNGVGSNHQKCLLHYFRDLYRTLDKNHADEFKAPFDETHGILNGAIDPMQNRPNHWCVQLRLRCRPLGNHTEGRGSQGCGHCRKPKTTPLRLRCRPLGNHTEGRGSPLTDRNGLFHVGASVTGHNHAQRQSETGLKMHVPTVWLSCRRPDSVLRLILHGV